MILTIKTSTPLCEMSLYDGDILVAENNWQADRRLSKDLLSQLEKFLKSNQSGFDKLTGLVVFSGPGSFTGLRIGTTVFNTLAYSLNIPIVGVSGENWQKSGLAKLKAGKNDKIVQPEYGHAANITKPKK